MDAILRLEAAGNMRSALIIKIPTHLMDNITINAIITTKTLSIPIEFIFLLFASVSLILIACSLLKPILQNINVTINTNIKSTISFGVILNISPTNKLEYFEKLPPLDKITNPNAVLKEEKTEI